MTTVRFATPWFRNGEIVYPAGVDLPADGFAEQLIADGVDGQVSGAADSATPGAPATGADVALQPASDPTTPAA